jgi:hypothetical protein
MEGPF